MSNNILNKEQQREHFQEIADAWNEAHKHLSEEERLDALNEVCARRFYLG